MDLITNNEKIIDRTKNTIVIEFRNVSMVYGDKTVLNNINLKVSEGSFVSIIGPTGCGKSTLFRLGLGYEEPTIGEILFNFDGELKQIKRGFGRERGVVFQKYSLYSRLKVWENVAFGLELTRFSLVGRFFQPSYYNGRKKFKEEAMYYLQQVGLVSDENQDAAYKYPYQLSGGMAQRVAIIQALITRPKILFMDEPFGALDETTRENMQIFIIDEWVKARDEGRDLTIFFITHSIEEALQLGTRIIAISQYYTNEDGSPSNGAKIVFDDSIPGVSPRFQSFRYTKECNELMKKITLDALEPTHKQNIDDFHLRHRLSVKEEDNQVIN